ncbi:hypothetical protein [Botrimarina colliarenosi]|uniref:hypothetical protein n=1 Tax=Botrimarina colliarenosi TaxID=2528001 RepID=UPI0018D3F117|nr:hypothetical protein [Botrimarina colliarenosi]
MLRSPKRRGVTVIETVVAFGLLVTVLSVSASLMVRHNRLLADERAYRVAVDELSNRLAVLVPLRPEAADRELAALDGLSFAGPLQGATLAGVVEREEVGRRLTLTLHWPNGDRQRPSVSLSGWAYGGAAEGEGQL